MGSEMIKHTTIEEDLIKHPELIPCLDVDSRGNATCFGWVSPIYYFSKEDFDLLEDSLK